MILEISHPTESKDLSQSPSALVPDLLKNTPVTVDQNFKGAERLKQLPPDLVLEELIKLFPEEQPEMLVKKLQTAWQDPTGARPQSTTNLEGNKSDVVVDMLQRVACLASDTPPLRLREDLRHQKPPFIVWVQDTINQIRNNKTQSADIGDVFRERTVEFDRRLSSFYTILDLALNNVMTTAKDPYRKGGEFNNDQEIYMSVMDECIPSQRQERRRHESITRVGGFLYKILQQLASYPQDIQERIQELQGKYEALEKVDKNIRLAPMLQVDFFDPNIEYIAYDTDQNRISATLNRVEQILNFYEKKNQPSSQ